MESVHNLLPSNIKQSTYQTLKKVASKSQDLYQASKYQAVRLNGYVGEKYPELIGQLKPRLIQTPALLLPFPSYQPFLKLINDIKDHPNTHNIKKVVQKYTMIIAAFPGIRDLLISVLIKTAGFTATGVKIDTIASIFQSKILGAYIANDSIFSYLHSKGATCFFDPTLLSLLLLGGTLYYYFCIYNQYNGNQNAFKWKVKDCFDNQQLTVPQKVSYENGKFNIKWKNLGYDNSKTWKALF